MEFRPQETGSPSTGLCGSRVTLKSLLPEDGMWESPTPALGGLIRVSGWRPQDLALGLHTGVGGSRNNDQVLVRIRISETGRVGEVRGRGGVVEMTGEGLGCDRGQLSLWV